MDIGARLREERERLEMTQEAFGLAGGVLKRALIRYEKGERMPDAVFLAAIAAAGADVLYILTGQRSSVAATATAPTIPPLAHDEEILLDNYRNSPPDARAAIKAASDAFARPARGAKRDKAA